MIEMYDKLGKPLTVEQWAALFEGWTLEDIEAYRRVAEDDVGPYWVSTVWIGHNMNYGPVGPPLIFETMVFAGGDEDTLGIDLDQYRWPDLNTAEQGHREVVELVRATYQPDPPTEDQADQPRERDHES